MSTNTEWARLASAVVYGLGVAEDVIRRSPTKPICAHVPSDKVTLRTPAAPYTGHAWSVLLTVTTTGITVEAYGADGETALCDAVALPYPATARGGYSYRDRVDVAVETALQHVAAAAVSA